MNMSKKNTSNIPENKGGGLQKSYYEDTQNSSKIDIIDLENDFLKLNRKSVNPFPVDVFPKKLQEIIFEASDKYQFSLDYLGAGMLSAASTAIGISHKVEVKNGWKEKANLFTVIVGRPGDSKSHALNFCFKPLHIKENQFFLEYENQLLEYEKSLNDITENKNKLEKPILKKFLISDFTPEALILVHSNNKRSLCIYVDELKGWLSNFNRYNNSGEAETYLSFWTGTQVTTDRASGKSLRLEDPFIGVIGSTQIAVLKEFAKGGRSSNGFIDRLLFVYPETQKTLKWNINKIDNIHLENYYTIISNLIELENNKDDKSVLIPIEKKAKLHLFDWQNNRPENYLFDYERSIDIKLQQYVIRFALILQLIHHVVDDKPKKQIELFAIKGGIQLFEYFYHNAIRVRHEITKKNYLDTLTELQKDILEDLPNTFSTREGINKACKIINGKPRISERQFKTYLNDQKLFKRLSRGKYEKRL